MPNVKNSFPMFDCIPFFSICITIMPLSSLKSYHRNRIIKSFVASNVLLILQILLDPLVCPENSLDLSTSNMNTHYATFVIQERRKLQTEEAKKRHLKYGKTDNLNVNQGFIQWNS